MTQPGLTSECLYCSQVDNFVISNQWKRGCPFYQRTAAAYYPDCSYCICITIHKHQRLSNIFNKIFDIHSIKTLNILYITILRYWIYITRLVISSPNISKVLLEEIVKWYDVMNALFIFTKSPFAKDDTPSLLKLNRPMKTTFFALKSPGHIHRVGMITVRRDGLFGWC